MGGDRSIRGKVRSREGQVSLFTFSHPIGKSKTVAMCGMMSYRHTPYSSIEAAIEVGRRFCHDNFGTRKPSRSFMVTDVLLFVVLVLLIVLFLLKFF